MRKLRGISGTPGVVFDVAASQATPEAALTSGSGHKKLILAVCFISQASVGWILPETK